MSKWTKKAKAASGPREVDILLREINDAAAAKGRMTQDMDRAVGILLGMDSESPVADDDIVISLDDLEDDDFLI